MHRILVCLDASSRAPFVLDTAVDLARRSGAKVLLLRAIGLPVEIDQAMFLHSAVALEEVLLAAARAELATLAQAVPTDLIEGFDVHVGTPWDTICREAKDRDCDLVVLGSHGHSILSRLLGTTAAKVVNHCERSVLLARPHESAALT
jgi:nucleotide-binding universal stress UspA family protein